MMSLSYTCSRSSNSEYIFLLLYLVYHTCIPKDVNTLVSFADAVREVKKYSAIHVMEKAVNVNANAFDHIQMKLFRSQRNLYISGFSLFLWL